MSCIPTEALHLLSERESSLTTSITFHQRQVGPALLFPMYIPASPDNWPEHSSCEIVSMGMSSNTVQPFAVTIKPDPDHSYTSPPSSSSSSASRSPASSTTSVKLEPAHWRLVPSRSLCETLKNILLKDWQGTHRHVQLNYPRQLRPPRPSVMRMKDSDDYITARAANPRTGLISPSVGSPSSPPWHTPDTPGEALSIVEGKGPSSPTPDVKARPVLRRANDGRKVYPKRSRDWRANHDGWIIENGVAVASPRVTRIRADAITARCPSVGSEDQFVVHMPSAQEPQPYAYPGYSSRQIEAFEHYKRKARRVSGEGYDKRLPHAAPVQAVPGAQYSYAGSELDTTSDRDALNATVIDRSLPTRRTATNPGPHLPLLHANSSAACFAPFSSPRTPTIIATKAPNHMIAMKSTSPKGAPHVRRKPTPTDSMLDHDIPYAHARDTGHSDRNVRLVRLPHSALSSLPHDERQKLVPSVDKIRACSLNCHTDGSRCLDRRTLSNSSTLFDTTKTPPGVEHASHDAASTLHTANKPQQEEGQLLSHLFEILITAVLAATTAYKHIRLPTVPRPGALEALYCEETSPQQKARALKALLSLSGQVVMLLSVVAALWQIGNVVLRLVEVVFWPFVLPLRVIRWCNGT